MLKRLRPVHLWLAVLVIAVGIMLTYAVRECRSDRPAQPINVPTLTPPAAVTSEPTDEEVEALERLKHHEDYRHANE